MCNTFVKTSHCKFDGNAGNGECKFSHDLAASFAARDPDLGDKCPLYTLNGFCRFGVTCRFGAAHLRPVSSTATVSAAKVSRAMFHV